MSKIKEFIKKNKVLILLIILALLLRSPWLYTTIEADEGTWGYTAWQILSDHSYTGIRDNKPPLLYLIYASSIHFFGNSIIPIRIFNNLLFIISLFFIFKFTNNIFTRKHAFFVTLFYIVFMNTPVFGGYLAMSESLLTPFLIISVFFFEKYVSTRKAYFIFVSSIFALISVLIKQQAFFIYALLISGLFVYKEKNKIKNIFFILSSLILSVVSVIFIDRLIILNLLQRTFIEFTKMSGVSTGYMPMDYNLWIILEGSLLWLFSLIGVIKILKSRMDKDRLFVFSWFFSGLVFTIVPPAFGHYYIFLIPPLAIFAGVGVDYVIKAKVNKRIFLGLVTILFLLMAWLVIKHHPNSTLDLGPLRWRWSSLDSYEQQILLSKYINERTDPKDRILVWGREPSILWLSERKSLLKNSITSCKNVNNYLDHDAEQFEKYVYSFENLKAIIFTERSRKCENMTGEIFSNPPWNYSKTKIYGIEIYIKD